MNDDRRIKTIKTLAERRGDRAVGAGVYAISASTVEKAIYVGETSDSRARLGKHRGGVRGQMNKTLAKIPGFEEEAARRRLLRRCSLYWVTVNDPPLRLGAEAVLTAWLRSPLNVRNGLTTRERHLEFRRRVRRSSGS